MLIELRSGSVRTKIAGPGERLVFRAFAWLLGRPALYRLSARLARALQRPFARRGVVRRLPLVLGQWTRTRDLPSVASRTFTERWRELERER